MNYRDNQATESKAIWNRTALTARRQIGAAPPLGSLRAAKRKATMQGVVACRRYPIVYLNMPKSACTTIKNLLYRLDNGTDYSDPLAIHSDKESFLRSKSVDRTSFLEAVARRKICFTFVREPFARVYSAFNEKIFDTGKYSFPKWRECVIENFGAVFSKAGAEYTKEQHSQNFLAFLRFVKANLAGETEFFPNPHWIDQKRLLSRYRQVLSVDLVGRIEQFELGMRYVLDVGGYQGDIDLSVRFNEGPKPPFKLSEVMTDEIHTMLNQLYSGDRTEFGYS